MMTPVEVAKANGRRMAREARKAVISYSTTTPKPEHWTAVEVDSVWGRHWTVMRDSEVDTFIRKTCVGDVALSDIDHAAKCWCLKD